MRFWLLAPLLALSFAAQAAPDPSPPHEAALAKAETLSLPAGEGRQLPVTVMEGLGKGPVVIFLHGLGGSPMAYQTLFNLLNISGSTVVAPTEPDSHDNPDFAKVDLPASFALRTADLMLVRGYVASRYPGRPVFLAGHSYGSLFAMMGGGAVTPAGPLAGPPVAGVVAFSTPGRIPGVVTPTTFQSLNVPMLLITGTNDTVPGFVPNAADHRFAFDTAAPGHKTLVTVEGGAHDLVVTQGAGSNDAIPLAMAFIDIFASGDAKAMAEFDSLPSTADLAVEHR